MALGLIAFLVWVVFLLCFVCVGNRVCSHRNVGCYVGRCGCSVGHVELSWLQTPGFMKDCVLLNSFVTMHRGNRKLFIAYRNHFQEEKEKRLRSLARWGVTLVR